MNTKKLNQEIKSRCISLYNEMVGKANPNDNVSVDLKVLCKDGIKDIDDFSILPQKIKGEKNITILLHAKDDSADSFSWQVNIPCKLDDYVWLVNKGQIGICRTIDYDYDEVNKILSPVMDFYVPSTNSMYRTTASGVEQLKFQPGEYVYFNDHSHEEDYGTFGYITGYLDQSHVFFITNFDIQNTERIKEVDHIAAFEHNINNIICAHVKHFIKAEDALTNKNSDLLKVKEDEDKFFKLSNMPLSEISDEDILWAMKQDYFNSFTSKTVWEAEARRREISK